MIYAPVHMTFTPSWSTPNRLQSRPFGENDSNFRRCRYAIHAMRGKCAVSSVKILILRFHTKTSFFANQSFLCYRQNRQFPGKSSLQTW